MLQIFRNFQLPTVLFVFFYLLVLGANSWIYPHELVATTTTLPSTLGRWLSQWVVHPTANRVAFMVLVFLQALVLNALVNQFRLAKQSTFIPAIAFIWMHFIGDTLDVCSPVVLANGFVLWAVYQLWSSGEKRVSLGVVFNIGFAAAMAALCYHGYMVLLLWVLLGWLLVRAFDPQEFILLLGGFLVPFFLMGTYQFVQDNLKQWWLEEIVAHYTQWTAYYTESATWLISLGLVGVVSIFALSQWSAIQFKTNTREKKAQQSTLLLLLLIGLSFLMQAQLYAYHFVVFAVPLGILFGLALQAPKSRALAEILHLLLFLVAIGLQYRQFFFA